MAENRLVLQDKHFGVLLPYIKDNNITDINYNGETLWVNDLEKGRYMVEGVDVDISTIEKLATKLANNMSVQFNKYSPFLEAETDMLRISIIHYTVTNTGYSVSIRKTPPERRLNYEKMINEEYCTEELDAFMSNAVKAGCNIVCCGLPGTGKTEYVKYLTKFIPPHEKAITIEDNLEIRYRKINPGKDCVEMKVGDTISYDKSIKLSMRQLPTWVILSEARSTEVLELIKALSTGAHCLTTLHTDDVRKVPERMKNMSKDVEDNDIYMFIDLVVLITSEVKAEGKIKRKIAQVGIVDHSMKDGKNKITMLYQDGSFVIDKIPEDSDILTKFKTAHIDNPFIKTIEDYELVEAPSTLFDINNDIESDTISIQEENLENVEIKS